ncbi:C6 zinc finger domain-containing protein [Didymella exigua CBS 183.55]|uniref:C6 zinc finger domain-containing protein n=1 Tax=Didymella exigua CBS 183.55 TaxID=1150837 RepID=A0A6A5RGK8_9PLEO|nr:C6 zinc finger domain-containing protein [Didymella exigua CBS 183.55]KAF1925636.1 C6 zinc finger domain-containing protein [Didymella exigua CBS 183.55]
MERLEAEVEQLKSLLHDLTPQQIPLHPPLEDAGFRTQGSELGLRDSVDTRPHIRSNALEKGVVTHNDAFAWFTSFFTGSHYLVPIFSESSDVMASVASRSAFLFDAIVSVGCRAEQGFNSPVFRQLQSRLREHLTTLLITCERPNLESVQAITLMAAYSENGYMLIALALRFATKLGLHKATDQLLALHHNRDLPGTEERELYRLQRVWHGICNLELFFSLDGGHLPRGKPRTTPRKIRALLNHTECTAVDVRLLSQVELNLIRTDAYSDILKYGGPSLLQDESTIRIKVHDTTIELSLWLSEWTNVVSREPIEHMRELALLNLHIQYDWALITLHLKAVSASGIENIAIMTDFQKEMIQIAKEASTRHLGHLLEVSTSPTSPCGAAPAYLNTFKGTMDYVWAKGAFSILLVLRLSVLLRNPVTHILTLLRDAHRVLEELKKVTIGYIPYFQILQTSIEKCEAAIGDYSAQQDIADPSLAVSGPAESDFQGYAPNQFTFEWDFPGLNLKHMPLGWQDLFVDIDNLF